MLVLADPPEKSVGTIIVPDSAKRHSGCLGQVVTCGPDVSCVVPGNRVAFASMFKGDVAPRFEHDGRHWYIVPDDQLHGVIE